MTPKLNDISNNNNLNIISQENYDAFNSFTFSTDLKLMGKMLHRFKYFIDTKDLPGDIVEIGVFKGSGVVSFSKFINIFCPNSNKKVIGFDIFDTTEAKNILTKDSDADLDNMFTVYNRVDHNDLTLQSVQQRIESAGISSDRYCLVPGDVETSIPAFLELNPGLKISLLYIDVDLDRPTYAALKYLWNRILPGGIILFDEYEYHKFTESVGVDRFLKETGIEYNIQSTNWVAPTAFMLKKGI
jgi:hypothetical protein